MKKAILLTIPLLFLIHFVKAQVCEPFQAGLNCGEAPICCENGLDGFFATLPFEMGNIMEFPGCNGIISNAHYLKFIAASEFLELGVQPSNCSIGNNNLIGMQAAIYAECINSSNPEASFPEVPVAVACDGNTNFFTLTAILEVGQTYYLMLDGFGGSICDYELVEVEGSTLAPSLETEMLDITGPDFIFTNDQYDFSITNVPYASNYEWQVTGGTILSGAGTTDVIVEITDDSNFEICVYAANDCTQTETACEAFEINPDLQVLQETVCEGECFVLNNTTFCEEGVYNVEVENGNEIEYYRLELTVSTILETEVSETICFGQCYIVDGISFCESGAYVVNLVSNAGCDSIVNLSLEVLDANEPQINLSSSGDLSCEDPTVTLFISTSQPVESYEWSGPGIDATNINSQNPEVNLPGVYTAVVTTLSGCTGQASIEINGDAGIPDITIEGNDPLNCNNQESIISATVSLSGLGYEWSGPNGFTESGETIRVDEAGAYTLIVTAPGGCMDTILVNVEENDDPLFVDPGPNRHIQCEFVLTLNAPGAMGANVIYQWTTLDGNILNGANTLTPRVNRNGTYTLTATNLADGCTGSADMIVYADMAIIEDEYLAFDCQTVSLQLDGTESYNGGDASITWTTNNGNIVEGENTLLPTIDAPGVYQLVIDRPGCLSFATVTVIDNTETPRLEINASTDAIYCGNPTILTAVTNEPNLSYTWMTGGTVISTEAAITTTTPGEYTIEIVNEFGCTNTASIMLENIADPSSVIISGDTELDCISNSTGQLSAIANGIDPFYDYNWFALSGGEIWTNSNNNTVGIIGGGTYCVEVSSFSSSCVIVECVDVTEVSDIQIDGVVTNTSCAGSYDGSIELQVMGGTSPYAYEWNTVPIQPSANLVGVSTGDYIVTVIDANGCSSSRLFTIESDDSETVIADAGADQILDCFTDVLVLDGGASVFPSGSTFEWVSTTGGVIEEGASTLFPTISSSGNYQLYVYSPNGCSDFDEVMVTEYEAEAGPSVSLNCNNTTVQLQGGNAQPDAVYEWTNSNGNVVGTSLTTTVDEAGVYTLVVTLANGCTYMDETTVSGDFIAPDLSLVSSTVSLVDCINPAKLEVQSNTPGVTYSWSGNGASGNNPILFVNDPGIYTVTVIGPNGCTSEASAQVIDERQPPIVIADDLQFLNCFNGNPLTLNIAVSGGSGSYDFFWSTSGSGNIVEELDEVALVDQAGVYDIEVQDVVTGCYGYGSITVQALDAVIETSSTIASCGIADATASVTTEYIHEPRFIWSTGATTSSIDGLAPEIYTVTITSAESTCDEVRTIEVTQDPSCFVVISGRLYDDEDLTCDLGGNINPKEGVTVRITPEYQEVVTDAEGYYEFLVPPGDYIVTPQLVSPFVVECPSESIAVSVPAGSSGSENNDFFIKALSGFDLYVTASSGAANAGSNQFYQVTFCNNWFTTIFGTVEFTHDPLLEFDPVAAGASSYDPETYTAVWEYEDLSFFECEFLNFRVFVPADVPDGSAITSTVTILPTQGDIAPENNTTTWTRTVVNDGGSQTVQDGEIEQYQEPLLTGKVISNLKQYPNPFTDQTTIEFVLEEEATVTLQVFDANGRLIKSYADFAPGFNQVQINDAIIPSKGIFFYQIVGAEVLVNGKMIKQ